MEALKPIFGDQALTYDQFVQALGSAKGIKLVNLEDGGYVDVHKHNRVVSERDAAQTALSTAQDTIKKFDGVDLDKMRSDMAALQTKYDTDLAAARLAAAVNLKLVQEGARNPKLAAAAIDAARLKLDGETVIGLDEQIKTLRETDGYLFDTYEEKVEGTGFAAGGAGDPPDYNNMSDADYYAAIASKKG